MIIATAIPKITDEFGSLNDVGWYASAFLLSGSAPILLFGKIYTFYSPKWLLLSAMGLFEIGNLISGLAPSSNTLIVGRAVSGLGSAGISTGCVVGVQYVLPLQKRPMAMGLFGAVFAFASVIGPLLGGALTDGAGWRWCFYVNIRSHPVCKFNIAKKLTIHSNWWRRHGRFGNCPEAAYTRLSRNKF